MAQNQLFSVPIWIAKMPNFLSERQRMISAANNTRNSEQSIPRSNVNGYHSLPNHQNDPELQQLIDLILQTSQQAIKDLEFRDGCVPMITNMWFNFNESRSHINVEHVHDGVFSGVFYLQCPVHSGQLVIKNPGINLLWKGLGLRSRSNIYNKIEENIEPFDGMLLIWPSYLPHSVLPNKHDEVRISISFNIDITKKV